MVRGFWGDILNSPLIPFGVEIENKEDKEKFFKHLNFQRVYVRSLHKSLPNRWLLTYQPTMCKGASIKLKLSNLTSSLSKDSNEFLTSIKMMIKRRKKKEKKERGIKF